VVIAAYGAMAIWLCEYVLGGIAPVSSSMRLRNGETAGVEKSMILLQSVTEADCLDHQHGRVTGRRTATSVAGAPTAV